MTAPANVTRLHTPTPDALFARARVMDGCLTRVEWSGRVEGQGCSTMSFYSPGPMHAACPVCRGLKPGQRADFIESAFGHKPDCSLRAALKGRP